MPQPPPTVMAKDARNAWVWVTLGAEQRARVKVTAIKESGRGFSKLSFVHPTCGRVTEEFPNRQPLVLAP